VDLVGDGRKRCVQLQRRVREHRRALR
jgi:hypothetical protein